MNTEDANGGKDEIVVEMILREGALLIVLDGDDDGATDLLAGAAVVDVPVSVAALPSPSPEYASRR